MGKHIKINGICILSVLSFIFLSPAFAEDLKPAAVLKPAPEKSAGKPAAGEDQTVYYLCKSGGAVRTIRSERKGSISRVYYTKDGVDKTVCKSSDFSICLDLINRIKSNLEAGNWKCRDISNTQVSSSFN